MPRFVQTTGGWVRSAPAKHLKHAFLACALSIVTSCSTPAPRTTTTLDIGTGTRVYVPVTSLYARQYQGLVRQAFDYSCGAAALATLLTYGV